MLKMLLLVFVSIAICAPIEKSRMESICNTYFNDQCKEKDERVEAIVATVNMTNENSGKFRIVMPKKFDEFMLQVLSPDGKRVGQFVEKDGSYSGPCVEYANYRKDNLFDESETAFQVSYEKNSSFEYTTLVFGTPFPQDGCYQWKDLLNLTANDTEMEFIEIIIGGHHHLTEGILERQEAMEDFAELPVTTTEKLKPGQSTKAVEGYMPDGTWVFFVEDGSDKIVEEQLNETDCLTSNSTENYTIIMLENEDIHVPLGPFHFSCDLTSVLYINSSFSTSEINITMANCTTKFACFAINTSAFNETWTNDDEICFTHNTTNLHEHYYCIELDNIPDPANNLQYNGTVLEDLRENSTLTDRIIYAFNQQMEFLNPMNESEYGKKFIFHYQSNETNSLILNQSNRTDDDSNKTEVSFDDYNFDNLDEGNLDLFN